MNNLQKIVPTPELLSEMESLEILGGAGDANVFLGKCEPTSFTDQCPTYNCTNVGCTNEGCKV